MRWYSRTVATKAAPFLEELQEDLLGGILGIARGAEQQKRLPEHRLDVRRGNGGKRTDVSPAQPLRQI